MISLVKYHHYHIIKIGMIFDKNRNITQGHGDHLNGVKIKIMFNN